MSHALHLPPVVIETARGLSEAVERLDDHPVIALDTESNSLFAYRERVCLIQISTPTTDYIVDTLAVSDLSPLARLFADMGTEKVFHGADYDIGTLRRDYGFVFHQIFDTMIAAASWESSSSGWPTCSASASASSWTSACSATTGQEAAALRGVGLRPPG